MFKKALNCLKIIFILLLVGGFLFFSNSFEKSVFAQEEGQTDAIAVRVLPNPSHYSPMLWYAKQKFTGAPTSMEVDGYDAVQDGRTVYVNVANVNGECLMSGQSCLSNSDCTSSHDPCRFYLFTNIYLISYNQEAGPSTISIFNKILENWIFNANLIQPGTCFDQATSTVCLTDTDCPDGNYCNSQKAQITRDIKRLASVVEMREAVENYKNSLGNYPTLDSGTYLTGRTISTWPSWQTTFSQEIGMSAPVDPINKLGDCGSQYDSTTCWDDENKSFAGSIPYGLPPGSNALVYWADDLGQNYELCGFMESGLLVGGDWGSCIGASTENNMPLIECGSLLGIIGEEFEGYISASDIDGDDLIITISNLPTDFAPDDTPNPNQKKIYSFSAPQSADGSIFRVEVSDGKSVATKDCTLSITGDNFIIYPIPDKKVILNSNLNFVIYANHSENDYEGMAFNFSGEPLNFMCTRSDPHITSDGRYDCVINYTPSALGTYNISVNATNASGETSTSQNFTMEVYNTPPVMNPLNCVNYVRRGAEYECEFSAYDPDGHSVDYYEFFIPSGMTPVYTPGVVSSGRFFGSSDIIGSYDVYITAMDEFGAVSLPAEMTFYVNSFCGDGDKQSPNMEGRGGPTDDGYEDCDDGNADDGDGCNTISANCSWTCRDGIVSLSEQCDDGNSDSSDACGNDCQWTCEEPGDITLSSGTGDALVYDDNDDVYSAKNSSTSDTYLKISGVMATPYIWIANSRTMTGLPYNKITKIRTHDGRKRTCTRTQNSVDCFWTNEWEERGQIIDIYDVGGTDPSRTAVNAETGDVWIANRGSGNVSKLDIEGNIIKVCPTNQPHDPNSEPRGIAIEENGDVWVANSGNGTVVKLDGSDRCGLLETVDIGGYPYGLAMDSQNNVWIADRNDAAASGGKKTPGKIKKIDTETLDVTEYPSGSNYINPYGITVDLNDNVWASRYYRSNRVAGVYKVDADTGQVVDYTLGAGVSYYGRGVSLDLFGNLWVVMDRTGIMKIFNLDDPYNGHEIYSKPSASVEPVGVCGDSYGQIWVVNRFSNSVDLYDVNGQLLDTFTVNPNVDVEPYTYSDMTGINRAKVFRKGIWRKTFDSGTGGEGQRWGDISWQEIIPVEETGDGGYESIVVEIRAYDPGTATTTDWFRPDDWNSIDLIDPQRGGRYLDVKVTMKSRHMGVTPVFWDLSIDCE